MTTNQKTVGFTEGAAANGAAQPADKREKKRNVGKIIARVAIYAVFVLYAVWILIPFLVVLITSITPEEE